MNPRYARAAKYARRGAELAILTYRRWQDLPPATRERYLKQAREYGDKAVKTLRNRQVGRGGSRGPRR